MPARFVSLDGTNDFIETPDAAALRVTGDLDLRADLAMDDWTPVSTLFVISKDDLTQRAYDFDVQTSGSLRLLWFSGGSVKLGVSTVAPTVTNGDRLQIRATLDVDNGASGHDVKFYTRASGTDLTDDTGWTQLGSTVTTAGTTSIDAATARMTLGAFGNPAQAFVAGDLYDAVIKDGIDGTLVARFNPNDAGIGATSVTDSDTGLVWTINGGTSVSA